jgi:molecular chaperone GrpE
MVKKASGGKKIQDLENQLKRALADYSNLQKRVEQEKEQIIDFAKAILVTRFLNILDTLEAVEKTIGKESSPQVHQGIEMTLKEFKRTLSEEGVEEIQTKGNFDPRFHEAVELVKGSEDNKIVGIVAKGYKIGDKILRPAKVKVGKKETN